MNHYDIVLIGHLGKGTIVPFKGSPFMEQGGPAFFGPIAASCLGKRIAAVTRISENEADILEPLKAAGIDLFLQPGNMIQLRAVFPTVNVDERQILLVKNGGNFGIEDVPAMEPGLVHMDDAPEKKEILSLVDFEKFDMMEAKALTGTDNLRDQADVLEEWGSSETVITSSGCILAQNKGKTSFARLTNRSNQGRMGRGDTVMGAYLARRLDYPIEDSLCFAAALTSIKLESAGPFKGSLEEVFARVSHDPFGRYQS
jgi:hypothetical protein